MLDRRTRLLRMFLRALGWIILRSLTRTKIHGRENLSVPGPVVFTANHNSTFDAMLMLLVLPLDAVLVGPGDFELLWPANRLMPYMKVILLNRGKFDKDGLKQMTDLLNAGGVLGLFPEGGTWEKPINDVKSGASFVSHKTDAKIVPMAFGGTYQVWRKMLLLRFPKIVVRVGKPQPPPVITNRKERQQELQAHAVDLMQTIYAMLPAETQQHYDRQARLQFSGVLCTPSEPLGRPEHDFSALAELVAKPNLFSPLHRNARLPVRPLVRHGHWFPAPQMKAAVEALQAAFTEGNFVGYLDYRLGEAKAQAIHTSLNEISALLDALGPEKTRVKFEVVVSEKS